MDAAVESGAVGPCATADEFRRVSCGGMKNAAPLLGNAAQATMTDYFVRRAIDARQAAAREVRSEGMTTTPRQHPSWLLKIIEAKRRAFDALSDEEKAAALDVQKERRQRVRAKRAASLSLATQIFKLHDAGHTAAEIAAIVSRRPVSIIHFAAKRGVFISRSALVVRRAVLLSREREDALRRLADDYGTQATEALADLLNFTLDEDAAVARRVLHVKRRAAA